MKKTSLLFLFLLFSALIQAQTSWTKDQQAVQQIVINLFEALSNRDSVSLKNSCTQDITLFENGSIWNADTLILKAITLNTATDFKRSNTFEFVSTTVDGHTAWATYHLHSDIIRNGKQSNVYWLETVVLQKVNEKWRINVLHSTLIKRT
ncbi:MAG TPA: nuclear transport factor 2 family protein [Ferruginibacter sp.]|nr:nuclear transport factor 2 family protein [Ferruginibacter sp.]